MNTYSRCGNWIDYHSYPRTSLACQAAVRRAPQRQFVQTEISDCCKSLLSCTPVQWGIGVMLAQMVGHLRLERRRTVLSRECLFRCEYRVTVC